MQLQQDCLQTKYSQKTLDDVAVPLQLIIPGSSVRFTEPVSKAKTKNEQTEVWGKDTMIQITPSSHLKSQEPKSLSQW